MFMLLNISKRKDMYDKTVKSGRFNDRNKLPKTIELWNKNILIMGFGRIGKSLIKRCIGFEMNVYVYDPFVSKEEIESLGGKKIEDLKEGVKKMDALTLHMPLNEKTKNIINYDVLKNMKKNSCLINIGRGNAIEEKDLLNHLKKNKNFYAYLDVFKDEPLKSSSQFWKLPNVTITPHVAGVTAIEPSVKYMYSKYKKLRKNKNVKSDVNPSDGY